MTSRVSFTIRRPPSSSVPISQHSPSPSRSSSRPASSIPHQVDSSDDEVEENATEFVTGFDQFGVQRLHKQPKPSGPLVIAPLANRDWRAVARARKEQRFIPDGTAAPTGKDGSQGGLGTRDALNSGPQATGLVKRERVISVEFEEDVLKTNEDEQIVASEEKLEESEDERARKALLASVGGSDGEVHAITIDSIPVGGNAFVRPPLDERDAYKQDVSTRPESATLQDYERVPVSQFGAALLRGMGWKEGTAASRTRGGLVEPWLPTSRPALLGLGAKERPPEDIPATGKVSQKSKMSAKRYVPLIKLEREGSARPPPPSRSRSRSPSRSGTASRVGSKSSSPYPSDKERRYQHHLKEKDFDNHGYEKAGREKGRDRDVDRDSRDRDRDAGRRQSELGDRGRDRERRRDRDREEWGDSGSGREHRRHERESSTGNGATRY